MDELIIQNSKRSSTITLLFRSKKKRTVDENVSDILKRPFLNKQSYSLAV
jgi:hypothetical protein